MHDFLYMKKKLNFHTIVSYFHNFISFRLWLNFTITLFRKKTIHRVFCTLVLSKRSFKAFLHSGQNLIVCLIWITDYWKWFKGLFFRYAWKKRTCKLYLNYIWLSVLKGIHEKKGLVSFIWITYDCQFWFSVQILLFSKSSITA